MLKAFQQLEAHYLLVRTSFPVAPSHVEYKLTLGREATDCMVELTDWIEEKIHALVDAHQDDTIDEQEAITVAALRSL